MMHTSVRYELLAWDSEAFGFPVASVAATRDRDVLAGSLEAARLAGAKLAYLRSTDADVVALGASLGVSPVSELVTFVRDVAGEVAGELAGHTRQTSHRAAVERWSYDEPTDDLVALAREAGRYSRFRIDDRIPTSVFERIYEAWITNSVRGLIADEVLVTRGAGGVVSGLVTVGPKHGRAEIGLLAVREDARGHGLGGTLVDAAVDWAAGRGFAQAQVVTQRANVAACRLYESCGYIAERREHVLHFWL